MRIPRIFTPQSLSVNQTCELDETPSHHITRVLRMQPGRELVLFNGRGGEYRATLSHVGKKTVAVAISGFSAIERESPLRIELAIGISRGERMDWVIQKATELGVARITPLFTERTEVKLSAPRLEKKVRHWEQIIVSTCEQCQRNRLALLTPPPSLTEWLEIVAAEKKFVLHHRTDGPALNTQQAPQTVALLIGPEGGLSEPEIAAAVGRGFSALALGPRVFRTETAPVATLSVLQHIWGDL